MIKDYYYLLGLPRGAPLSDIKQAYRRLAAEYHPDKVSGLSPEVQREATAKMMELNEAIDVLTDPERRAEYDQNLELIPERKPKPARGPAVAPTARPAASPPPPANPEVQPSPQATPAAATPAEVKPAAFSAAAPTEMARPTPPVAPAPSASEAPSPAAPAAAPPRGMLIEEHVRKLKGTLLKLPLKWKESSLRGWQWALEGGDLRRSLVVAHRHLENLSLLSLRNLQTAMESLLDERKLSLRPTAVIVLVSYDRLMDAKAVQSQLPSVVGGDRGWLKNVHPLIVLYDGQTQRAGLFGTPGNDPEIQRVVRLLVGGR